MCTILMEHAVSAHIDSGWLKKADADRSATNAELSKKIVEIVLRAMLDIVWEMDNVYLGVQSAHLSNPVIVQ